MTSVVAGCEDESPCRCSAWNRKAVAARCPWHLRIDDQAVPIPMLEPSRVQVAFSWSRKNRSVSWWQQCYDRTIANMSSASVRSPWKPIRGASGTRKSVALVNDTRWCISCRWKQALVDSTSKDAAVSTTAVDRYRHRPVATTSVALAVVNATSVAWYGAGVAIRVAVAR